MSSYSSREAREEKQSRCGAPEGRGSDLGCQTIYMGGGAEGQGYIIQSGWKDRSDQIEMGPVSFPRYINLEAVGSH